MRRLPPGPHPASGSCQRPLTLTAFASPIGSVDGHTLQIEKLKGTKPTEKIDLSNKRLGVASAIIIASCIKENGVLKELKCAAARQCPLSCQCPLTHSRTHFLPSLHVPTRVNKRAYIK